MAFWSGIFLCSLLMFSCAKPEMEMQSKVQFRFPLSQNSSPLKYKKQNSKGIRLPNFSSLNEIDCYAVSVSWGGAGKCLDTSGTQIISSVNNIHGSVPDGGILEFEVDSGPGRKFSIIGFTTTLNYCPDFSALTLTEQSAISDPKLVGETIADIEGAIVEVVVDISMSGAKDFSKCMGIPFAWQETNQAVWGTSKWSSASWGP